MSGAAGAAVLAEAAAGATSVPRTMVRVSARLSIPEALERLEAERAESGANLLLVPDKERWGEVLPRVAGSVRVANPVSTWLDCLQEPRGEDVALHFREAALGF